MLVSLGGNSVSITKSELVDRLAEKHSLLTQQDVKAGVGLLIDTMTQALASGERVELRGFGTFSLRHRKEGVRRNPSNGKPVVVPAKHSVYYRPGREMKKRVNR